MTATNDGHGRALAHRGGAGPSSVETSYLYDIGVLRGLAALERVRRLGGPPWADAVGAVSATGAGEIIVGDAAAALHGWPLALAHDGQLELCVPAHADE